MRLALTLDSNHTDYADLLKHHFYPAIRPAKIRESYVLQSCIDRYDLNPESIEHLKKILTNDAARALGKDLIPKQLNLTAQSADKLQKLAASLSCSTSATMRALTLYWLDIYNESSCESLNESNVLAELDRLDIELDTMRSLIESIRRSIVTKSTSAV